MNNFRNRKHLIWGLILTVIIIIVVVWLSGPRRISKIVPKNAVICQIMYAGISDNATEDIVGTVTLQGEMLEGLLDFLDRYELTPIWSFGPNTPGDRHYTLVFYGETTLLTEAMLSSNGIVKIGSRKYQFSNWTADDADVFHQMINKKSD